MDARDTGQPATDVKAVIGVPLYNGARNGHLHEALDSLLSQTYPDVAFVFVDDGSTDQTRDVVAAIAANDRRIVLTHNVSRLGIVRNWGHVFHLARERFPKASYFAWGSDHDRWDHRWLERLVAELDAHPSAVMAYPRFMRIDEHGREILIKGSSTGIRTEGLSRRQRFAAAPASKIGAGNLVYGLFRAESLEHAGIYPLVHRPDIYIMIELSLYGEVRRVDETLWYRREWSTPRNAVPSTIAASTKRSGGWRGSLARVSGIGAITRQHRSIFLDRVPLYSRYPSWLQHLCLFSWRLVIRGRGRPDVGRAEASVYAVRLLIASMRAQKILQMSLDDWREQKRRERAMAKASRVDAVLKNHPTNARRSK